MSKVVGFVIGAALVAIGILTGNPALIIQGGAMIVTQAIVDLTAPKAPARAASEMTIALGEQPRCALFGETFTPGSLVDGFDYGGKYDDDWEVLVIRLADHKCASLTGFFVNDIYVRYTGDGNYPQFDGSHFKLFFRADTTTDPLPAIVTANGPRWTAADKGESGCDVVVAYRADAPDAKKPAWPGGRPHFGFVVKGAFCYDPRKDSTVPGGSGPHRRDDSSTWEWSENPVICRYSWVRGIYANDDTTDQTKLLVGRGLTADEAPPENIIAAANLCDEIATDALRYAQVDDSGLSYTAGMELSAGGGWFIRYGNGRGDPIEWWSLPTRTFFGTSSGSGVAAGTVGNADLAVDGKAYFVGQYIGAFGIVHTALYSCPPLGSFSSVDIPAGPWFSTPTRVFDAVDGTRTIFCGVPAGSTGYIDGGTASVVVDTNTGRDFFQHADGTIWGIFQPDASSADIELKQLVGGALSYTFTGLVARSAPGFPSGCHVPAYAHFFVVSDGKWYTINDDTTGAPGTIKASGAFAGSTLNLPRKVTGQTKFLSGFSEISLLDASTIETFNPSDWLGEDTGPSPRLYDFVNDAIITHPQFLSHTTWRMLRPSIRYRVAGPVYADQQFIDVEQMFAVAVAGNIITREGSVELEPAQAKSVVATFTDADLLSGSQVAWNQRFLSESAGDWVNTVVARYIEPDQKWNDHAAPVVRVTADIVADGKPREAQLTLRLVRDQGQALRVAEINRRLGRLWGRATVKLGPRFCELEAGDWVAWTSARYFGGATRIFRIEAYSIDEKWQNMLTLREIAATVFDDDGVFAIDRSVPISTRPRPDVGTPDAGNWALAATTLVSTGASVPALEITGSSSDDDQAQAVLVEYWKSDGVTDPTVAPDTIPWTSVGRYPPDTTKIDITSLAGLGTYYVALRYVVSGIPGDRLVMGPVTIGDLDVGGQVTPLINASPWKAAVRAKTTAALPASTYANGTAGTGATLTATANGALAAQDGVALAAGERLLVANEAAGSHNGIYALTQVGSVSTPYVLTRTADADGAGELVNACVKVSEGTAAADQEWQCTTNAPIVVGTTALTWAQFGAAPVVDNDTTLAADSTTAVPSQHATKTYVDNKVAGLSWKQEVRAATTANGTLATAFANGQVIDGVALATGDRILLKNQTTGSQNGIYVVAASGAPSRATDADAASELVNATCYVSEGTANADTQWTCSTNAPITPGTTALTFAQLTSGGTITLTGDVTGSGSGSFATTIAVGVVTYGKMQDVSATSRVLARKTAGPGSPEECTLSDVLDFIGAAAQGDILYRGAATWARLAAGTSGYFLKAQGAGANPVWDVAWSGSAGADLGAFHAYDERPSGTNGGDATLNTWVTRILNTVKYNAITAAALQTSAVTITIASPGVVTWNAHGFANGASMMLTTTGALPTGLSINTTYYVVSSAANTFQLSLTVGGAAINTSGSQSGVHTAWSGEISLPAGTYDIEANAPCYIVSAATGYKLRLYDVTNAAELISGSSKWSNVGAEQSCHVQGRFALAGTVRVRLEMIATATRAGGFGVNAGITSVANHFADIKLRRVL